MSEERRQREILQEEKTDLAVARTNLENKVIYFTKNSFKKWPQLVFGNLDWL